MKQIPNIIIIVLDTARASNLSPYGYEKDTTPNLAELADEGVVYEKAFTPSPWSLPSHTSLFTGVYPSKHGAHELQCIAKILRILRLNQTTVFTVSD